MASQNSETASNIFSISENKPQEYSETNETNESSQLLTKCRNISGKKQGDIWLYVNQGISLGQEHYKASCKYCPVSWERGRPDDMRLHLAQQCLNVPDEIKYFWRDFIAEEKTPTRKKTKHNQSEITIHFSTIKPLPEAQRMVLDKIYETAALIWNDLHYSEESCTQLLVEMRSWKRKDEPYHLSYNSTHENTNNGETNNLDDINESEYLESLTLNIADSVDLILTEFLASGNAIFSLEPVTNNRARDVGNMSYDPIELARQM
ncbi:8443_t:CDS:2, partial [Dentiscutata erythropus]